MGVGEVGRAGMFRIWGYKVTGEKIMVIAKVSN